MQFSKVHRMNNKNKQDMYLDDYGEIFFNEILKIENSKCLVIPNGFFSYLPINMGRYNGKYFYQLNGFEYIPSINLESIKAKNDK